MKNNTNIIHSLIENESFQLFVLFDDTQSKQYWEQWLRDNPENNAAFFEAKKVLTSFKIKTIKIDPNKYDIDLQKLRDALAKKRTSKLLSLKLNYKAILKYAALIIVSIGIGYSSVDLFDFKSEQVVVSTIIEKSNPKGQKSIIMLPDGTKVNLNSNSSFSYLEDAATSTRNVYLTGEAFFEVAKNKEKPFIVHSNGITTKALGTSFNINAFLDNHKVDVYLATGEVEIQSGNDFLVLKPNEAAQFDTLNKDLKQVNKTQYKVLAWKSDLIIFDNSTIKEVIKTLENWYNVTLYIEGIPSPAWKVSGEFENEKIENILKSLSFTSSFEYEIKNDIIKLKF